MLGFCFVVVVIFSVLSGLWCELRCSPPGGCGVVVFLVVLGGDVMGRFQLVDGRGGCMGIGSLEQMEVLMVDLSSHGFDVKIVPFEVVETPLDVALGEIERELGGRGVVLDEALVDWCRHLSKQEEW